MSKQEGDDEQRRFDAILRQLLHTPPRPRSKLKLGKGKATRKDDDSASAEKRPAPSA
jgi:hypothetical protein